jgi:hypothetical protein
MFGFDGRVVILGEDDMKGGKRRCECTRGRLDIVNVVV